MGFGSAIHISRPLSGTLTSWFLTLGSLCTILLKSSSPASSKVNFSRTVGGHIFAHWSKTDSGRAFAFKPDEPDLYLVGTGGKIYGWNAFWFFPVKLLLLKQCSDEGVVYLCTTQYASTYINIFQVKQHKQILSQLRKSPPSSIHSRQTIERVQVVSIELHNILLDIPMEKYR